MKSVGEVMAIGRTFQESMQKALRGLETGMDGLNPLIDRNQSDWRQDLDERVLETGPQRLWYVADAMRTGYSLEKLFEMTAIDPWFLAQIKEIIDLETGLQSRALNDISPDELFRIKQKGFSDRRLAQLLPGETEASVRDYRWKHKIHPVYKRVDTCAAEFATSTAYLYSSYETECEADPSTKKKIMVLGGGPNRIGQGIEFDYCCVHAALAMREDGYETIMVNCNPETVSTDYDTSDRLFFDPLTLEDVLEICRLEKPTGVIVQFGGQTPLKLARDLEAAGVPIIGTTPDSIDLAEDRERFQALVNQLDLLQPPNATASSAEQAVPLANKIGYPLVVRPSYVLGGRAMEIVYNDEDLIHYMKTAVSVSNDSPVLLDRFLEDATEIDVDAICDGKEVYIGGIMQHIEQAGIHSGDSACALPPYSLPDDIQNRIREMTEKLAFGLNVLGLMNIQFAVKGDQIYLLEVNPRASRTVPFVSKSIGLPLAKIAARCMVGQTLAEQNITKEIIPVHFSVKEAVFPFIKFLGVDPILGPEMKSTGEVMGVGKTFGEAFAKSQSAAGVEFPLKGTVLISVRDEDKEAAAGLAAELVQLGFSIVATGGTADYLDNKNIPCQHVNKVREGRPHIVDMIIDRKIDLIINTTEGKQAIADSFTIRRKALQQKICYTTTISGAWALKEAIELEATSDVYPLHELHEKLLN
jgi:carbamoyl-phosphate synthase large subunit